MPPKYYRIDKYIIPTWFPLSFPRELLTSFLTVYNDIFYIVYVGVPGVKPERLEEGMTVRHCALSLVGTLLIYS